jgi:hypothetical protein
LLGDACGRAWRGGLWVYGSLGGVVRGSKSLDREIGVFVFADGLGCLV